MKPGDTERPSEREAIEATAATWLFERQDGLTSEYEVEFNKWMESDPRHREAYGRLENAWSTLQELRDYRPESLRHPDHDLILEAPRASRRPLLFPVIAGVAAALLVMSVWWFATERHRGSDAQQVFSTNASGYDSVTLVDGSEVHLNADTEVRVQYTSAERRVKLVRGEAFFAVAKNKARPFTVEAGDVAVHAIGTAFNVCLAPAAVDVVVSEGKVKVTDVAVPSFSSAGQPGGVAPSGRHYPELLVANERLHIPAVRTGAAMSALSPQKLDEPSMRQTLLWKEARLVFTETPLSEVVEQFNRYNKVQLVLGDDGLAARPVGGNFHADNPEVFVNLLVKTHEISAERPDADHIVLRRVR